MARRGAPEEWRGQQTAGAQEHAIGRSALSETAWSSGAAGCAHIPLVCWLIAREPPAASAHAGASARDKLASAAALHGAPCTAPRARHDHPAPLLPTAPPSTTDQASLLARSAVVSVKVFSSKHQPRARSLAQHVPTVSDRERRHGTCRDPAECCDRPRLNWMPAVHLQSRTLFTVNIRPNLDTRGLRAQPKACVQGGRRAAPAGRAAPSPERAGVSAAAHDSGRSCPPSQIHARVASTRGGRCGEPSASSHSWRPTCYPVSQASPRPSPFATSSLTSAAAAAQQDGGTRAGGHPGDLRCHQGGCAPPAHPRRGCARAG